MLFWWDRVRKITEELSRYIYSERKEIADIQWKDAWYKTPEEADASDLPWVKWTPDQKWGGRDKHAWFRFDVRAPESSTSKPLAMLIYTDENGWDATNPQFLVFVDGKPVQGTDVNHHEVLLTESAQADNVFRVDLQAYGGMEAKPTILRAEKVVINRDVEKLYFDLVVPLKAVSRLDKDDERRIDTVEALNAAINRLDLREPGSEAFNQSVLEAIQVLEERYYQALCEPDKVTATAIGHSHIDVAWMWTLAQTREKSARSFSTVLKLMEQYPEYTFMSSQPQLYEYVKEDYPEIYERIRERVAEGRWEAEGAMWLESDCNVVSGESLVRQILIGTRFFAEEFGVTNKVLWLPDVFGYSAALPQILKKSGIDYFMTTKIAWSQYNKMPYDTFMWKGIDGTEILTYFITTRDYEKEPQGHFTTYNGVLTPVQVMGAWQRYQHKDINKDVLVAYGYGDGGGGPSKEMLEEGRRMTKGLPAVPQVQFGTVLDFFKRLEKKVAGHKRLPKWVGELYLEYHRGTYTSMARNKRDNRQSELLYQDAEFLASLAAMTGKAYPAKQLYDNWKTILRNQFHDILPGTSIKEVYDDSAKEYEEVLSTGKTIADESLRAVTDRIGTDGASVVVWNTLPFVRSDYVKVDVPKQLENPAVTVETGDTIPVQFITEDGERKALFFAENVPSRGYKVFRWADEKKEAATELTVTQNVLENRFFRIELDETGALTSVYHKASERELIPEGARANVLQAFEDKPMNWDNWDIDIYYEEKMWELDKVDKVTVLETGPYRGCVEIWKPFSRSYIIQRIYVYADSDRIDFETEVDWKEDQVLLKVAFPVDVHADKATFDIQFGNVERPTHRNTSWDVARFEVVHHKWMDLSEAGFGVSILNDSKYGCDVQGSTMRLTLLKSGMHPFNKADREQHKFTYSLMPHEGGWREAGVVQAGYEVNVPLRAVNTEEQEGDWPAVFSMLEIDADNVIVETVKKAEDDDDLIIRMYESHNKRTDVNLNFGVPVARIIECDLMEQEIGEPLELGQPDGSEHVGSSGADGVGNAGALAEPRFLSAATIRVNPYEIKTFKVKLA